MSKDRKSHAFYPKSGRYVSISISISMSVSVSVSIYIYMYVYIYTHAEMLVQILTL